MSPTFLDAFLSRAERDPQGVAFVLYGDGDAPAVTNGALRDGAVRWAAALGAAGATSGDVVLLSLPLGRALLEAFVGALVAGCVPSMMPLPTPKQDPALFWSSHDALFAHLGGGLLVTTAANAAAVATFVTSTTVRVLTPEIAASASEMRPTKHAARRGDAVACLQHSSGTTGLKKGVALTYAAIEAQLAALGAVLDLSADDTIVSWLPLYHDMGFVACLLQPLRTGMTCVLLDPFAWLVDPLSLFEAAARHRGALAWLPNFAFAHLVNAAEDERRVDLSSLRAVIDCSETCRPETLASFGARFAPWGLRADAPRTSYAMAETVFAVTQSTGVPATVVVERAALEMGIVRRHAGGVALVASGAPLPGVSIVILDDNGAALPSGRVGQIVVAAPFLFSGYYRDPTRTARVLDEGRYRTGDLGFLLDGELFVLGRADDLIVLLGRNVYANEIESLLSDVPGVKPGRLVALGIEDDEIGSQALTLVAETVAGADETAIRSGIRLRLESILGLTPKRIVLVGAGWLVKSTSGKIARAENRRKFLALRTPGNRRSA